MMSWATAMMMAPVVMIFALSFVAFLYAIVMMVWDSRREWWLWATLGAYGLTVLLLMSIV